MIVLIIKEFFSWVWESAQSYIVRVLDTVSVGWTIGAPLLDMGVITDSLKTYLNPVFYVVSWFCAVAFTIVRVMIKIEDWKKKKLYNENYKIETKSLPEVVKSIESELIKDVKIDQKEKAVIEELAKIYIDMKNKNDGT